MKVARCATLRIAIGMVCLALANDRNSPADDLFGGAAEADMVRIETADARSNAQSGRINTRNNSAQPEAVVAPEALPADNIENLTAVKSLRDVSLNIGVNGQVPADVTVPNRSADAIVGNDTQRGFADTVYFWQASNMVHRPLYFEQKYVERYGANFGLMQPVASGVQFYGDVAVLPIKLLRHPPCECQYSLGYGRPGNTGVRCPRY
ncbi:MAG: hypothetical protein QM775_03145 [Pirellulales bacterium]